MRTSAVLERPAGERNENDVRVADDGDEVER
jgi:hypothetical protein